ncbi:NAD(P)-dependent oxidoreductase [Silvimonas sp.]|uniref:NAD-dependent epimerase/dehydratase family protein n=1 Tax=Silvimonas sp. TaxID=2650811 RepID=UPI00283DD653|nr:NAD(P)-dependent oxidoreductase [Silvimonas sp.]MDR3430272.1 NAD(P)-dependent oxidoreductase [Silvimonas sp.]
MAFPMPLERYVVTGPSGWIGQAMLATLAARLGEGWVDQVTCFASSARNMHTAGGEVRVRALDAISPDDVAGAHVIHLAYLTREKAAQLGERAFCDTNLAIDDAVLGAIADATPASLFVASSGAAQMGAQGRDLHPYGLAKLRQEARFLDWGRSVGVPVLAGRIFNLAGPYINKVDGYAIANFAKQALAAEQISIMATTPVFRSFLHVEDLCELVLDSARARLMHGAPVDLCGAEIVEMADLAALVAQAVGGNPVITRGQVDTSRPSVYLGDFTQTRVLAMQTNFRLRPLRQQIADTVAWLGHKALRYTEPLNGA